MGGNVSFFRKKKGKNNFFPIEKKQALPVINISNEEQKTLLPSSLSSQTVLGCAFQAGDVEEKKATFLPVVTLLPSSSIQDRLAKMLALVCEKNNLNKSTIETIITVQTPYLDDILNMLELFLVLPLPCTAEIIKEIKEEGKYAKEISAALLRLNKKINLTVSFILSVIMTGRFAFTTANVFLKLDKHKIELTEKIMEIIFNAAPDVQGVKDIAAALRYIADYISSLLSINWTLDVEMKIRGLLKLDIRDGINQPLSFIREVDMFCTNKKNVLSTSVRSIQLPDVLIQKIAEADKPQNLAEAIVLFHKNSISLSPESLGLLAANSYHALRIADTLISTLKRKPVSEENMHLIIRAGGKAGRVAKKLMQSPAPAAKPKPNHVIVDKYADEYGLESSESSEQKAAEPQPKKQAKKIRFRLNRLGNTKKTETATAIPAPQDRSSRSSSPRR